jgi:hypothetical protein
MRKQQEEKLLPAQQSSWGQEFASQPLHPWNNTYSVSEKKKIILYFRTEEKKILWPVILICFILS